MALTAILGAGVMGETLLSGLIRAGRRVDDLLVGAAGLGVWNFQHVYRATGPARAAADAFLRDVTSGDATGAYELLCADTRERYSRDEFARQLAVPSVIVEYAIDDVSVATDRGRLRGTATVRLTRRSGVVDRREVPLVHHGDGWRVCGDPF